MVVKLNGNKKNPLKTLMYLRIKNSGVNKKMFLTNFTEPNHLQKTALSIPGFLRGGQL